MKSFRLFSRIRKSLGLFFLLLPTFVCGCGKSSVVEYVPTPGETASMYEGAFEPYTKDSPPLTSDDLKRGKAKRTVEIFPTEAYFGDTIYIAEFIENVSDAPIHDFNKNRPPVWDMPGFAVRISSPQLENKYRWRFENPTGVCCALKKEQHRSSLEPGEKFCSRIVYPDICPLEDFDAPFWKELREKLTPEGIVCAIELEYNRGEENVFTASQDILIKPRPAAEMALLEKWYKNTPKELFPFQEGWSFSNSGKSNIRLSPIPIRTYNPWIFIRVGNRKPSDPNNPRTLKGWRELEASLTPSTMRDEVRLSRFRLEYYAARNATKANEIKKEYRDWLDSLPEVQRVVMERYVYGRYEFGKNDADVFRKISELRK